MNSRTWIVAVGVLVMLGVGCGGGVDSTSETGSGLDNTDPATSDPAAEPDGSATAVPEPTKPPAAPAPTVAPTTVPNANLVAGSIEPVVFQDDFGTSVAPIFASKCASCHNAGGPGSPHWQLSTAQDVVSTHEWIAEVVEARYMPPWPASELSVTFHNNRSLRSDEIAAIAMWSAAGAPLDVDANMAISAPNGVIALDADAEIDPHETFQGSPEVPDDYRCLIYELDIDEPRWMSGFEFVPDQAQIVHHAIGYLAPAVALAEARQLSSIDELGGWQCYGSSGLSAGDDVFLGWAPGQLPTQFPDGSGLRANPGDFVVVQIHYHFDSADAPQDASTLRIDWSDADDLDPIEVDEFIGPAEIPCMASESGPLCDRNAALAQAYAKYGLTGVLADGINQVCGVGPEDFAHMTDGIATSSCTIPVRHYGEIVSILGHEHEIGKSIRLTINAGRADEQILLDIPDWSFDWQFNYYPAETVMLEPGDTVLLECAWDRSRRAADLEPAYVFWADGTNDEMCFATIATRRLGDAAPATAADSGPFEADDLQLSLPPELATCLTEAGFAVDRAPARDEIDGFVEQLFSCAAPAEIGRLLTDLIALNFGGLVNNDGIACLSERLSAIDQARSLLMFTLDDATDAERQPTGDLVGDCVLLSDALEEFGFPLPDDTRACVDDVGRDLLVQATIDGELPEEQTLFRTINPCLAGD